MIPIISKHIKRKTAGGQEVNGRRSNLVHSGFEKDALFKDCDFNFHTKIDKNCIRSYYKIVNNNVHEKKSRIRTNPVYFFL